MTTDKPKPKRDRPERRNGKPVGRPTRLTRSVHKRLIASLRAGNYLETAAASCGLPVQSVRHWLKLGGKARYDHERTGEPIPDNRVAWAKFSAAVESARAESEEEGLAIITEAGRNGSWQAIAWRLERTRPQRYARRTMTELSGPEGGPVQVHGTMASAIDAALAATPEITTDQDEDEDDD